jgi:type IV pilus assembly protein PilX
MKPAMRQPRSRERGVVLIFTLIILLILTIGGVALVRSMNNSLFSAGNLSFRRDLVNQGEQAVSTVLTEFKPGGALAAVGAADSDLQSANYKATPLATNAQGIPTALLTLAGFQAVGQTSNDITGATGDVTIRYLIDRLCTGSPCTSLNSVQSSAAPPGGSGLSGGAPVAPPTATVYRLSVVVYGPRNTQVFMQSTFTKPD